MWRRLKIFFRLIISVLKKILESILIVAALFYAILVFDIYINTESLETVNGSLNDFCQNISKRPIFTKGPVVFKVDKGTIIFHLSFYSTRTGLAGYSPFFIFPHHRTIILAEESLKSSNLESLVAHELGHIQGGFKHIGPPKKMEKYADDFSKNIVESQSLKKEP